MKCYVWKPCRDLHRLDKFQSSIQGGLNFKFSDNESDFPVHFSKVNDLLDQHQAKEVWRENVLLWSKEEQRMTLKWLGWVMHICLKFQVLIFSPSEVDDMLNEHWAKTVLKDNVSTSIYVICCFLSRSIWTYGLVVEASVSESGNIHLNAAECWNSLQFLGHFAWHQACKCAALTRALLYYCTLYNFKFLSWISSVVI